MKNRNPDPDPYEAFAVEAMPRLLRLVTPMLRSKSDAEDVVQETLFALWKRRESVDDWAAYAARAAWLNALKRKSRRRDWVPLEDHEKHQAPRLLADPELEPWELEQAVATLPPAQQAVLRLRFYAGHSFHEIGESLEISINTAASRLRYALAALRQTLKINGGSHGKD